MRLLTRSAGMGSLVLLPFLTALGGTRFQIAQTPSESTSFELSLYRKLVASEPKSNIVFSPYSASEALSMVREGALGETAREMDAIINNASPVDATVRKTLRNDLSNSGPASTVNIANSLWIKKGFKVLPAFTKTIEQNYQAKMGFLDFSGNRTGSARTINDWISSVTAKQISRLVRPTDFDVSTRAMLINSVFFSGRWETPFGKNTVLEAFAGVDAEISVPTMHRLASVRADERFSAITLNYVGDYRMIIVVPNANVDTAVGLDTAAGALFNERFVFPCPNVSVSIPKWKIEKEHDLVPSLKQLGIHDLFNSKANLGAIAPISAGRHLFVSDLKQKALISVDEEGTRAAAATESVITLESLPATRESCPKEVKANKPFVYAIQHVPTGQILFIGQLTNPQRSE
jgi:serpin B